MVSSYRGIVLVIGLGGPEAPGRLHLGDDLPAEHARLVELGDIGRRNCLLAVAGGEDGRPVLGAGVRALPVELGRIVGHREEDPQDLAIRDLLRVEGDLDGLGVARLTAAHLVIDGRPRGAARIARHGAGDAPGVLEHGLHPPEAAARQDGGLGGGGRGRVERRRRQGHGLLAGRTGGSDRRDGDRHDGGGESRHGA
jgi:hypothetical protein